MRPPDADVRDRILRSRGRNLAVEAGAGTGKTTLLVSRVAALLADGASIRRLAVITFTRKAAAELGARLRRELAEARADGHAWAANALVEIDGAAIGTTDSFCRSILADFPLQAGLPPGFALVDEIAQDALLDVAWERCLARGGDAQRHLFERLREVGSDPARLRTLGAEVADNRDLELAPTGEPGGGNLAECFDAALEPAVAAASACTDPEDRLLRRIRALELDSRIAREVGGAAADRILLRHRRGGRCYATQQGRAAAWGGAEAKARAVAALTELDERVDEALARRGAALAADVAEWLRTYVEEYGRVKRERGLADFRDLALETRRLLVTDAHARRRIAARWDTILLDEVQDTDPLQMEIAFLLAAAEPDLDDPLASPLRDGALFLVGDPKQSIYRFRRADIELYERARAQMAEGGETLPVVANFRSHPSILRFVNHVFEGWMEPPQGETFQARYEAVLAGLPPGDDDDEIRASLLLPDAAFQEELMETGGAATLRAEERQELEIHSVTRLVRRILGRDDAGEPWTVRDRGATAPRPARATDVAVLVRKIAWGDSLVDALRRTDIPAAVSGGKRFHAREEIRTLAALLHTIVDPENRLARFAALRSPAFALPDDELVCRFAPGHAGPAAGRLAEAESQLDRLARDARDLPVPDFLEKLCEETALLAVFGFRPDGPGRVESLRLLVEAADSLADAGFDTLPSFVRWLEEQAAESGRSVFGELDPGTDASVRVLTMHKAKGLEFPIVILADLAGAPSSRSAVLCDRARGRIEFRLEGAREVATPGFEEASEREKARAKAEEVRLLYVAATRARDHLVLSWPQGRTGFLAQLPARLGGAAGRAIDSDVVRTLRAEDLPAVPDAWRMHDVDVDTAVRAARSRAERTLPFDARPERPLRRAPNVVAVTALTAGSDDDAVGLGNAKPSTGRSNADLPDAWPASTLGSFLHRCLELFDPAAPHGLEDVRDAALAALGPEGHVTDENRTRLTARLRHLDGDSTIAELRGLLVDPRVRFFREVPFLLAREGGFLSGTIDLLVEHEDGELTVVDYKSGSDHPAAMERYRRQAAAYAWAAGRITGRTVREVRLMLLGGATARAQAFAADPELLAQGEALVR